MRAFAPFSSCSRRGAVHCGRKGSHAPCATHAGRRSVNAAVLAPSTPSTSNAEALLALKRSLQVVTDDAAVAEPSRRDSDAPAYRAGAAQDWGLPTGLAVTWLGTSSGTPTRDRNISCTLVRYQHAMYMVDVGEGSYRQFQMTGMNLQQVEAIFITHLHGDHCFGVGGMLLALDAAKRHLPTPEQRATHIYGPPGLLSYLHTVLVVGGVQQQLSSPVYVTEFVETNKDHSSVPYTSQLSPGCHQPVEGFGGGVFACRLLPDAQEPPLLPPSVAKDVAGMGLQQSPSSSHHRAAPFLAKHQLSWSIPCRLAHVKAAQMQHRIPCWGYVFDERPQQEREQQQQQQPGGHHSSSAQHGQRQKRPLAAAGPQPGSRRVVVLGDTMNSRPIVPWALGAHVLAHEATFAGGMEDTAFKAQHSTAWMAGQFARIIGAQLLVLTHFSARYPHKHTTKPGGGGGREGGGRGGGRQQPEEDMSEEASSRTLYQEAAEEFGRSSVLLARDLFTVHVPQPDAQGHSAVPVGAASLPTAAAAAGVRPSSGEQSLDEAPRQEAAALLATLPRRQVRMQQPSSMRAAASRQPRSRV